MCLSSWELNSQTIHPKYLESIIIFLGFIPKLTSNFDVIGMRVKLWRTENFISIEEFSRMVTIPEEEIKKIEQARYCKVDKIRNRKINYFLKRNKSITSGLVAQ